MQKHLSLWLLTTHLIQVHNWTVSTGPSVFTELENVRSKPTNRPVPDLGPADFLTPVIDSNCSLASLFIMHKIADEILAISKKKKKTELNHLQDTRDILYLLFFPLCKTQERVE